MPRITKHLKPLQALTTPGPTAALLLLARIRCTAVTSDKVPQCAKLPPPLSAPHGSSLEHSEEPSVGTREGCGAGGVTAHIPALAFSTLPSHHCCSSPSSWGQTWAIPPEKSGTPLFCCSFGQTCSVMPTREQLGSAGLVTPQAKVLSHPARSWH